MKLDTIWLGMHVNIIENYIDPVPLLCSQATPPLIVCAHEIGHYPLTAFSIVPLAVINMSRSPGCQASPLIDAIFYRLPYFTSGLTTNVSVENILDDFVVRNLDGLKLYSFFVTLTH